MDYPVLAAEQRFVFPAERENVLPASSVAGDHPGIQYLAPCLDVVVLDDPPDRNICFHQVVFEFRGKPPDGSMRYRIDQHITACQRLESRRYGN